MKKVFFLFAFLFTVVCFAAPPPDMPTSFLTEDVGFFRPQGDIAVQTIEVQEVAFAYIGDCIIYEVSKATTDNSLMLPDANIAQGIIMYGNFFGHNYGYLPDLKNSNYSYPFGANYLV